MSNRETLIKCSTEPIHVWFALRRNKDNDEKHTHMCIRELEIGEDYIDILRLRAKQYGGIWRLYRTVNKRDLQKALKKFMHTLIDIEPNRIIKLYTIWKTCLMNPSCKASNNILLDIDLKDSSTINCINNWLDIHNVEVMEKAETLNGYHIVVKRETFNSEDFKNDISLQDYIQFVDIKKDALIYKSTFEC